MTRPRKQTVDYFPHTAKHGKTMTILEQRYKNDGYAFWFKLLEILADTEGHYLNCQDRGSWLYLLSKTYLEADQATEILDLLSELGAIDPELWADKIVWSENFVKGVADVYRNRRVETPTRPDNYTAKPASEGISTCSLHPDTDSYPQSKVKESKEKDMPPPEVGGGSYPKDFEAVYAAYPKNRRGSKKNAYRQFKLIKASIPSINEIIRSIQRQVAEKAKADSMGIFYPEFKDLERWLKGALWEREPFDFAAERINQGTPEWVREHERRELQEEERKTRQLRERYTRVPQ